MEITGRLTADAAVHETKSGAKVVNFTLAVNDRFKTKSGELKEQVVYFNCAYWIATGIAAYLLKGALLEVSGRVSASVWTSKTGEAKASLNFHADRIKLHGKASAENKAQANTEPSVETTPATDDLPF